MSPSAEHWGPWMETLWCSCIAPPAAWGLGGPYPRCFTLLFLSLSAAFWCLLGECGKAEGPLLLLLPRRFAKTLRQQLQVHRKVLQQHRRGGGPPPGGSPSHGAAASASNCAVCGAEAAAGGGCPSVSESRAFVHAVRNRSVGGLHAAAATVLGLCCVLFDEQLRSEKIKGTSMLFSVTGLLSGGYFVWDIFVVLWDWGPGSVQWLMHAMISLCSVCTPFLFESGSPMSYYAACLLLLEASTPLFSLRFFLLKAGAAQQLAGLAVHWLFVASFFIARLVFGCCFLFPSLWRALTANPDTAHISDFRKTLYRLAMGIFGALQLFWFVQLLLTPRRAARKHKTG